MTKEIKEFLARLNEPPPDANPAQTLAELKARIGFYQHERLIHLIVTVLFAILTLISFTAFMCFDLSLGFLALPAFFLILLVPYVVHYYFLENSVQALYKIYYRLSSERFTDSVSESVDRR